MKPAFLSAATLVAFLLAFAAWAQDHFAGVGLLLAVHKDALTVIHIVPDSPASRAGLSEGLLVRKIDGVITEGKPLKDCVEMIRGAAGTKVKLELFDSSRNKTNTVELTREEIKT